jgi:hypothetical protein
VGHRRRLRSCDPALIRSNTFEMEWPPRSGRRRTFPEIDRAAWFGVAEARRKILKGQMVFVDRLLEALGPSARAGAAPRARRRALPSGSALKLVFRCSVATTCRRLASRVSPDGMARRAEALSLQSGCNRRAGRNLGHDRIFRYGATHTWEASICRKLPYLTWTALSWPRWTFMRSPGTKRW